MKLDKYLIILLAFVVVEFVISATILNPSQYTSDSGAYVMVVKKLAGELVEWPTEHYTTNLLSPLVTLPLYLLTQNMDISYYISSLFFYLLLAVGSYYLGIVIKLDSKMSALLSALIVSHPIVLGYSSLALTDVPGFALAVLSILTLLKSKSILHNGIIFGLTILTRPQYFVMFPMYFVDKDLKKILGVFVISAIFTVAWSMFSNAALHPITQFIAVEQLVSGQEMVEKNLLEHLSVGGRLKDLFIGLTFLFFYQIFFLLYGIKELKVKRVNIIFLLISFTSIISLYFYPFKIARYFLILLLPFTTWAIIGLSRFFTEIKQKRFLIPSILLVILLNQFLTFIFFRSGLNPLPS
jgi:hypothetical protein